MTSEGNKSSIKMDDFDKFIAKTIISGTLIAETQLHIGSGEKSEASDNPLIRVNYEGDQTPYIPGSSLKGVVRSFLEGVLIQREDKEDIITYLFGRSDNKLRIRGHIAFTDSMPLGAIATHIKPGVAIDSVTGAAKAGAKYSLETIAPGSRFSFKMIVENVDLRKDTALTKSLMLALKELKQGNISVGGKTSAGLGVVRLVDAKVEVLTEDAVKDLSMQYLDITDSLSL